MTPPDFYDKCAAHDWFYQYSDDARVYRSGIDAANELLALAHADPRLLVIFTAWQAHMTSGPSFGTEKAPKPERPHNATPTP